MTELLFITWCDGTVHAINCEILREKLAHELMSFDLDYYWAKSLAMLASRDELLELANRLQYDEVKDHLVQVDMDYPICHRRLDWPNAQKSIIPATELPNHVREFVRGKMRAHA